MNSSVVREKFFHYFKDKGHNIIPSASVINQSDKNLMFTNAGMNQFRNIFLGNQESKFFRVANSQKCLRVSGKHNDLEEVGVDTYHHTFFEMLGNWSFGDYFKKEIIEWSYDLIVNIYGINKEDVYVSVFEGSREDNLEFDQVAFDEWKKFFSEDRIISGNKKDNFWEMGDIGPCGPCSEIHIDLRSESDKRKIKGANLVNKDHPQVVEIWNLVFIQYNRKKDGSLIKLDKNYVDTGMGLERLCMALQKKESTYDTDLFADIIKKIEDISNKKYLSGDENVDIAIRVISDHIRALIFTISDGQVPSNSGPGYVIRRILRRAVKYGYTNLDIKTPFIYELVDIVISKYLTIYPDLKNQSEYISSLIYEEEKGFLKTLNQGLSLISQIIESNPNDKIISGEDSFKLYDTYGFPVDLTSLIANENDFQVDIDGFNEYMKIQKSRSKSTSNEEIKEWVIVSETSSNNIFKGYDHYELESKVFKYRECINSEGDTQYHLVTNQTPFYPEGGGQIGDTGEIISNSASIAVKNTFRDGEDIIHLVDNLPIELGDSLLMKIDKNRRLSIQRNHTSTHLLQFALKKTLGNHVEQRGSMLTEDIFRFDFSHQSKLSNKELSDAEKIVKSLIKDEIQCIEEKQANYNDAVKAGAIGLFSEKYGDVVRTIKFGESYELCGGTHVKNTREIEDFKIISEGSQAFGIRRIVATSNKTRIKEEELKNQVIKETAESEKANKILQKEIDSKNKIKIQSIKGLIIKEIKQVNGLNTFTGELDLDPFRGKTPEEASREEVASIVNPESDLNLFQKTGRANINRIKSNFTEQEIRLLKSFENHHANPLKQSGWLVYGLPEDELAKTRFYLAQRGVKGGNVLEQIRIYPEGIHDQAHELGERIIGQMRKRGGRSIEKILGDLDPEEYSKIRTFEGRKQYIDKYIDGITEIDNKINKVLDALYANRLNDDTALDALIDINANIEDPKSLGILDKLLEQIDAEPGFEPFDDTANIQRAAQVKKEDQQLQGTLNRFLRQALERNRQKFSRFDTFDDALDAAEQILERQGGGQRKLFYDSDGNEQYVSFTEQAERLARLLFENQ